MERLTIFLLVCLTPPLLYSRTVFQDTVDAPFDLVWKAAIESIKEMGCQVEESFPVESDNYLFKAKLSSAFCVLATGYDSTMAVFDRYAERIPYIRGAVWTSARIQYTFYLTELPDGRVAVRLIGQMSGYEEYVTAKFHYFDSKGILEKELFQRFLALVQKLWNPEARNR